MIAAESKIAYSDKKMPFYFPNPDFNGIFKKTWTAYHITTTQQ